MKFLNLLRAPISGQSGRWRWLKSFVFGVMFAALALGIRALLEPALGIKAPFVLFYPTIIAASWWGGTGAGITTLILCGPVATWLRLSELHYLWLNSTADALALAL